ncbi:bzip transcription factor [Diplodia corticola]|uniref:Bzip transcription factor n=1 Tax=Diplodia corticola TaxID=236234 RepID=A0A1J9QPV7_9PEZI|nr:bzip transcription factor [Diplodia corticola]OJD30958.1 bzip transcription factor [Diplodia corticola]
MSWLLEHTLHQIDECLQGIQDVGQDVLGVQDSHTVEDDFALFIDWDPQVSRHPSIEASPYAEVSGYGGQWTGTEGIKLNTDSSLQGTFNCLKLDDIHTQLSGPPAPQRLNFTEPLLPSAHSKNFGPSVQDWEDALRMIESLPGKHDCVAEELQRLAGMDDKRQRNNAASARFRVKKKQREEELTRRVQRLRSRADDLSACIARLEEENRGLRDTLLAMPGK